MAEESYSGDDESLYDFEHYGTPHQGATPHSGRYKWGSGDEDSLTRANGLLGQVARLKEQGISNSTEIARALGMTTTEYRARYSMAWNEAENYTRNRALNLQKQGWGATAIGKELGRSESTVRGWLKDGREVRKDIATDISEKLMASVPKNGGLDIGKSSELYLGTSADKLKVAVQMAVDKGYEVHYMYENQLGTGPGQKTTLKLLTAPGVKVSGPEGLYAHRERIASLAKNLDDIPEGSSGALKPPVSIDSKRVKIVYAEDKFAGFKGVERDGVMLINPKAPDLQLPDGKRYAQVRIAVDGTHYLKGMALVGDPRSFPPGVDVAFCTNKHKGTPKMDVLKKMQTIKSTNGTEVIDTENPFKAAVRLQPMYVDPKTGKKKQSALNILNTEGDWDGWSKNLPSQMLSKQEPSFASQQLGIALDRSRLNLKEIKSLTNPVVKQKLLQEFADECDSAAVSLKAAAVPRQKSHVILPINSLSDREIYAPNYRNGEKVMLVRYPHAGRFEMPELVVNNRNKEGLKYIGNAKDAVGINSKVAERLSGADFDGDTVQVIPNKSGQIKNAAPLKGLQGFDPKESYALPKDIKPNDKRLISPEMKQRQMGIVSNLITDMTIKGARPDELVRAVRHSMVVIDSEKHKLDWKQSETDNNIKALKEKFQSGGASTLVSRAKGVVRLPERKPRSMKNGGPIDPETGEKRYELTGESHGRAVRNSKGEVVRYETVPNLTKSTKLAEAKDARELSSGTLMESIYARYSNGMKDLGNQSRKAYLQAEPFKVDPQARKTYAPEVKKMVAQLNEAKKNQPLERQAQVIANERLRAIREDHPDYDKEDLKKAGQKELKRARAIVGIQSKRVDLTDRDWEAIQARAISANRLREILQYADPDRVRELATPRKKEKLPSWAIARAKSLMNAGYTNAEVADALGISTSTLSENLGK